MSQHTYRLYMRRRPTTEEIKFGYADYHYRYFTRVCATPPKRIKWLKNTWVLVHAELVTGDEQ
jgi:hypothetical protein